MADTLERQRLAEAHDKAVPWRAWGPYLSERQWGTVREDYSPDGDAWDYFTHDQARSRAYRWGEDGLAGFSDDKQRLCFALALWNGNDPILKERLFGLTNSEGNHGEDVKEYYFYLDSTPTHSYMKYLYKYPQAAFPYADLVETNRARSRTEPEYELLDTGVFDGDRYFDVLVEYAKETPDEILVRVTVTNRGDVAANLHVLPTLWFRNTWSWGDGEAKPALREVAARAGMSTVHAHHPGLGDRYFSCAGTVPLLFTENETNNERLFGSPNSAPYAKDGINEFVVRGSLGAINPAQCGTKVAAHDIARLEPGKSHTIRLRVGLEIPAPDAFGERFDGVVASRAAEADDFYAGVLHGLGEDEARVARQALAGMLWSKQYYYFDLDAWLRSHGDDMAAGSAIQGLRNREWFHMINDDIISMPDKWEYPWYASWDLAFHCVTLSLVDVDFAKSQLSLMMNELYIHPSGALPAYEWNFSDVNPPVHVFAAKWVYDMEKLSRGHGDVAFLTRTFHKLLLNFTWWVNRKDKLGNGIFEGGFLGLDNIGVFDRSAPLPTGGTLEQADGTGWMAFYALNMMDVAMELASEDPLFEDMAVKFAEHFMWIVIALLRKTPDKASLWDEEDGFFYDVLRLPDGSSTRLKVRSLVGLLPLCAVLVLDKDTVERFPDARNLLRRRLSEHPEMRDAFPAFDRPGVNGSRVLAILDETKLRRVLTRVLDEGEFWGPYGIRSISRYHFDHPYVFNVDGQEYKVGYLPAESDTGMFGGNSNWRGPVWMPMNALLYRCLMQFYRYYGDDFTIECPTGSGRKLTLFAVAQELATNLSSIFLRDEDGRRPVYGGTEKFQTDPHWRDYVLFYEYFHGDNGAGIGASHQTGWTGLIAQLMTLRRVLTPQAWLARGRASVREDLLIERGVQPADVDEVVATTGQPNS